MKSTIALTLAVFNTLVFLLLVLFLFQPEVAQKPFQYFTAQELKVTNVPLTPVPSSASVSAAPSASPSATKKPLQAPPLSVTIKP
jgi:hypothetical protein